MDRTVFSYAFVAVPGISLACHPLEARVSGGVTAEMSGQTLEHMAILREAAEARGQMEPIIKDIYKRKNQSFTESVRQTAEAQRQLQKSIDNLKKSMEKLENKIADDGKGNKKNDVRIQIELFHFNFERPNIPAFNIHISSDESHSDEGPRAENEPEVRSEGPAD